MKKWVAQVRSQIAKYITKSIIFFSPVRISSAPAVHVIILSFRATRHDCVRWLVKSLVRCPFVKKITISNNNSSVSFPSQFFLQDPRIEFVAQQEDQPCINRFNLALSSDAEYFLLIDDDVMLTPSQIAMLARWAEKEKERVHSITGSIFFNRYMQFFYRKNTEVDVAHAVYAFSKACLRAFWDNYNYCQTKVNNKMLVFCDDLILSLSSPQRPLLHDLGRVYFDPDHSSRWSVHLKPGFSEFRLHLFQTLRNRKTP